MSELFNQNNQNSDESNPLEALVGEGKKFASVEDLAKGKLESDRYIEELKQKLQATENTNSRLDELLEKVEKSGATVAPENNSKADNTNDSSSAGADTKAHNAEDIEALLEKKLAERDAQANVERNLSNVRETLKQTFGDDAPVAVTNRAKELGMSVEALENLAGTNPNAFLALFNTQNTSQVSPTPLKSTVSSPATNSNKVEKGWSHFREMRRKEPHRFHSPAVQKEINDLSDKYGVDAFFNS